MGANPGDGAGGAVAGAGGAGGGQAEGGAAGGGQAGSGLGGAGQSQGGVAGKNQGGAGAAQGGAGQSQGGAGQNQGGVAGFQTTKSDKPRASGASVSDTDRQSIADGNNAFTFDLYGQLQADPKNADQNLFFSPISFTFALGMTSAGAVGTTLSELSKGMHYTLSQQKLQPALNSLSQQLSSYPQQAKDHAKQFNQPIVPDARMNIVNALWGSGGDVWKPAFLDVLAEDYGTGINLADFAGNAEGERIIINDWVASETEQRIKDLLPMGSISAETSLVLVNAIDLTFPWDNPFHPQSTTQKPFTVEGKSAQMVDTMRGTTDSQYAEDELAQYGTIDLYDRTLTLGIYVPKEGKFAAFEAALGSEISALHGASKFATLELSLPKFGFTSPTLLVSKAFENLGVKAPFGIDGEMADFSGITSSEQLSLVEIYHKASLHLDEGGVQAAAATAVGAAGGGGGPVLTPFAVERSFFVEIRDVKTGAILFFGRILDPAQGG